MLDRTDPSPAGRDAASAAKSGPLSGVRIIDLTSVVLGAYATQILGDLGADIIKVEPAGDGETRGGDIMRWGGEAPSGADTGMGPLFMNFNRNKRSVKLDLRTPAGREALYKLVASADALTTNIRMESMKRNGADYETMKAIKPDLVYVHACGFGSDGPYGGRGAYDDLIQAASGAADLYSRTYGDGIPRYMPTLMGDKTVGLFMVYATMAALFQRERTGEGQFVEVPMFECTTHYIMVENLYGHYFDPPHGPLGYSRILNPDRRPYKTKDGWIAMTPYSDKNWLDFFTLAGRREEFLADARFRTYPERIKNIGLLYASLDEMTVEKTTEEWLDALTRANIPCMRVHTLDTIMSDPHFEATGFFGRAEHPTEGRVVDMKHPVTFSAASTATRHMPEPLGNSTHAALREAGLGDDEIESLREQGAFGPEA